MRVDRSLCAVLVLAVLLAAATRAGAHPFHVSLAEADWNAKSGKLEVAVRVHPDDLETAVRRQTGRRLRLEDARVAPAIEQYVTQSIRFQAGKQILPIAWVGHEVSVKAAWIYFEVPLPSGPAGITITNGLLSHVPGQTNLVSVRQGRRHVALEFTSKTRTLAVNFQPEDRVTSPAPN